MWYQNQQLWEKSTNYKDIGHAFEVEICNSEQPCFIQTALSKPYENHNHKISNRYIHTKRKNNPNTILELVIKSQEKKKEEEGKKKNLQKQIRNN